MPNLITKKVKKFGIRSAHITLPRDWIDKDVEIKLLNSGPIEKEINWKNIKNLIQEEIESAKRGY